MLEMVIYGMLECFENVRRMLDRKTAINKDFRPFSNILTFFPIDY